ncbi:MAG: glycosyltransferase family 4 protein [Magnetococcales bacterium]|nr:glycosyltransferase family 4 protein [Magnetococcales bacterium]
MTVPTKKIRVLHILRTADIGGIERSVLDLSQSQNQSNHTTAEALFAWSATGEYSENFKEAEIPCHSLGLKNGYSGSLSLFRKLRKLYRQFDIIHFHLFNPFMAFSAMGLGIPLVFTDHGFSIIRGPLKIRHRLLRSIFRGFARVALARIIYNSKFTLEAASQSFPYALKIGCIVLNGISGMKKEPDSPLSPSFNGCSRNKETCFVVGTATRFVPFKRVDYLIRAFAQFQDGKNCKLLLVGGGVLQPEYEQLVQELGIEGVTEFTGYQRDVSFYQNKMDVAVIPSQAESFGLAILETLALGKPTLIFSDGGGLVEAVEQQFPNDVVDSVEALTARLEQLFDQRKSIANDVAARKAFVAGFSIDKMTANLHQVYREVLTL